MEEHQESFTQEEPVEQLQENNQTQYQTPTIDNPLLNEYEQMKKNSNSELMETVKSMMRYREKRTYHVFASDKTDYFSCMWEQLQTKMNQESSHLETDLLEAVSIRQTNIFYDILEQRLQISEHYKVKSLGDEQQKSKKVSMLRQQESQIHKKLQDINEQISEMKNNHHQSRFKAFQLDESKMKEYEEFMKQQKKAKEDRLKVIQEQRKRQEEQKIKKENQEKQQREKTRQEKKEEMMKHIKEKEELRKKMRSERQERNKQYKIISKSLAEQPPLFKQLQSKYHSRYAQQQNEKRQKILSQRHSMLQTDVKALQEHERKYEEMRSQREKQRRQRMQELQKMMQLQQQQIHHKYKSHSDFKNKVIDPRIQEKRLALEKKEKAKRYIEQTVKQRYLPRIDEQKRKEFLKLIQDMNKKKVKKVIREDGSVDYEELKPSDPRMVGLQYLQKTKEMAAKARAKRKSSDQIQETHQQEHPKVFDYLSQRRKKGTSMSHRDKYGFVNRKGVSFEQKIKKVELQSQKLQELARQKQMKLKYGKFTTSEQILQHKQQIDQHYMDIINMKLKLINVKEQ